MAQERQIIWEGAAKRYGRHRALHPTNLAIGKGVTAVLGANGAGKTTLLSIALGLVGPSAGKAFICGAKASSMAARRSCGAVLQEAALPGLLTVQELLELGTSGYESPDQPGTVIARLGLEGLERKRYKHLSAGQQRRVQIAFALMGRPQVLFLDEPTTGLDADARRRLWNVIRDQAAHQAVVLTTHYLEEAEALADRVVVLQDGAVVADETTDALRRRVGGSVISCITALELARLVDLPSVTAADREGRRATIMTADAAATLRLLLAEDSSVSELTVANPSLEDALASLQRKPL
jgi:ABC-2 type transport system ATP-binding protein